MNPSVIIDHVLISVVSWLVGMIVGGGLGCLCALAAHGLFSVLPVLRKLAMLLPGRTLVVGLLLFVWSPIIPVRIGIGPEAGMIMAGLLMFLLALPFTIVVLLEYWHPSTLVVRLVAGARTLAIASVAVAAAVGVLGGGGIGQFLIQCMQLLRWNQAFTGWLILVVLALIPDVLLGILQFACSFIPGKGQPAAE